MTQNDHSTQGPQKRGQKNEHSHAIAQTQDINRAIADLDNIRTHLAAGSLFQGFGPVVMAITGGLAVVTLLAQSRWPVPLADPAFGYFATWITIACISCAMIGIEMVARSKRHHGGLADAMIIKAIEQFFHVGLAGAALAFIFMKFAPDTIWTLPGLWQVLVGIGIFSSIRTLPKSILFVGVWYFFAGLVVLVLAAKARTVSPMMMGFPFAIGQFLMAWILRTASGEKL